MDKEKEREIKASGGRAQLLILPVGSSSGGLRRTGEWKNVCFPGVHSVPVFDYCCWYADGMLIIVLYT